MKKIQSGIRSDIKSIQHSFRIRSKGMDAQTKNETKENFAWILASTALFHSIHAEIEPTIEKERESYLRLFGKRQSEFNQGYSMDLDKYQNFATFRPGAIEHDLSVDNSEVGASFLAGMNKAESDSRSKADLNALKS